MLFPLHTDLFKWWEKSRLEGIVYFGFVLLMFGFSLCILRVCFCYEGWNTEYHFMKVQFYIHVYMGWVLRLLKFLQWVPVDKV